MSEREERKPSKNMLKSTAGTKSICDIWVVSEIKDFARSSPSAFFQQVTPLMNSEKWEKFVTTPVSRYNCQNTPARKKTLLLYHHQQCSVENYKKNSKHSLRPVSHILHNFLRLYCKTFLSQGFPVKHFNFKMN